jgi:hypothetical protein
MDEIEIKNQDIKNKKHIAIKRTRIKLNTKTK